MPTIDAEIRSKTAAFADDIAALVRRAALEAVQTALGTTGAVAPVVTARRGRPSRRAAQAATAAARKSASARAVPSRGRALGHVGGRKPAARKRAPGEKRPPAELVKLTDKLGDYIKSHPGHRMEAIGKALGVPTRELNLPVKKLLAGKKIRVQGHKRATEYFPA
jgi:hypothetical protein